MSELIIKLKGEVTDTNFDEWKNDLIAKLGRINTELSTDDDFANAESDVRAIKAGEKSLKDAKATALEQAAEIQKLFDAIDTVSSEARDARLALERQIKKRKAEIKDDIVDAGVEAVKGYLQKQSEALQSLRHSWLERSAFEDEIKGKRTTSSMQKAVLGLAEKIKTEISDREASINDNQKVIDNIDEQYSAVFQDEQSLLLMESDALKSTIEERIEYFETEKKKQPVEAAAEEQSQESNEENATEPEDTEPEDTKSEEEAYIHPADQSHVISIEVFAEIDDAQTLFDEIDDQYSSREIVGEIKLS